MTAIVTNAKSRIAYNIAKNLGQKGIKVITSDFVSLSMSAFSRYSKGHFLYPSPYNTNNEKFIDCIIDKIISSKVDVLIPVSEETFLISKFKERFEKHVGLAVPDYDQVLLAHNKDKWEFIARTLGICVPETFDPTTLRNDSGKLKKMKFPLLVKPKQGGGGWGISHANSLNELEKILEHDRYCERSWDRFYLQKKIIGETHCVAMLFCKGEIRAKVAYRQLREYPLGNGQATFRISLNSPKAERNLQTLLEHIKWHGVCQADFVIEEKSGEPFLIDLNPRFWGSIIQGIASGVDFPYLYYRMALEGDVAPVEGFNAGIMTRWIGGDVRAFIPSLRESSRKIEFLKNFFFPGNGKILKDDFNFQDPLPFFAWYLDTIIRVLKNRTFKQISHDSLKGIWD